VHGSFPGIVQIIVAVLAFVIRTVEQGMLVAGTSDYFSLTRPIQAGPAFTWLFFSPTDTGE
jgi:hypothetical protein